MADDASGRPTGELGRPRLLRRARSLQDRIQFDAATYSVSTTTTNGSPLAVELFAPDGHRVFASRTDLGATPATIALPVRRLAPGAYLLRTTLDGQSDARRIAVF